jgi:two-component system sensor histidine kinase YesM
MISSLRRLFEKNFRDSRLIKKIMIIYMTISAVPILFLGIFLIVQERGTMQRQQTSAVRSALMQASSSVTSDIRVYNNLSDYVAYNQTVSDVLTGSYSNRYEMFEQYEKTIDPILVAPSYFSPDIEKLKIYVGNDLPSHGVTIAHLADIKNNAWYKQCKNSLNQSVTWIIDYKSHKIRSVRIMPLMELNDVRAVLYLEVKYDALFFELQ